MKLKICGLKDYNNILQVTALEADYFGFIFYPQSPRYLLLDDKLLINDLYKLRNKVGVFVDQDLSEIFKIHDLINLEFVQLHGSESPEICRQLKLRGLKIIKAFAIDEDFDFAITGKYESLVDLFLFDNGTKNLHGGTGESFDWKLLEKYHGMTNFLLSGGIGAENISKIPLNNYPGLIGLDINSRVELQPGLKDIEKIKTIINYLAEKPC